MQGLCIPQTTTITTAPVLVHITVIPVIRATQAPDPTWSVFDTLVYTIGANDESRARTTTMITTTIIMAILTPPTTGIATHTIPLAIVTVPHTMAEAVTTMTPIPPTTLQRPTKSHATAGSRHW